MHRPERTCIGCRRRSNKYELLRLVVDTAAIVVDLKQSEPGRGAYLHRDPDCLELAVRRRALGRALRTPQFDGRPLAALVQPHLQRDAATT